MTVRVSRKMRRKLKRTISPVVGRRGRKHVQPRVKEKLARDDAQIYGEVVLMSELIIYRGEGVVLVSAEVVRGSVGVVHVSAVINLVMRHVGRRSAKDALPVAIEVVHERIANVIVSAAGIKTVNVIVTMNAIETANANVNVNVIVIKAVTANAIEAVILKEKSHRVTP